VFAAWFPAAAIRGNRLSVPSGAKTDRNTDGREADVEGVKALSEAE
jgi:hypothetical protein